MSNKYTSIVRAARVYQMRYKTGGKGKKCREELFAELDKVLGAIGTRFFYVGPGGDDNASGRTWKERWGTMSAVDHALLFAGDVIMVGPGTYKELL